MKIANLGSYQNEGVHLVILLPNKKILLSRLYNKYRCFRGRWEMTSFKVLPEGIEDSKIIQDTLKMDFGIQMSRVKASALNYVGSYNPTKYKTVFIYLLQINSMVEVKIDSMRQIRSIYYPKLLVEVQRYPEHFYETVSMVLETLRKEKKEAILMG